MSLSIIVAYDRDYGIGIDNKLPWNLPEDLKWFKKITTDKTVVMGSNTYFSLPRRYRPLPKRKNIVLTNDIEKKKYIEFEGAFVENSIENILELAKTEDVLIIGGANIYSQFIPFCDTLYLTLIDAYFGCDVKFPYVNLRNYKHQYKSEIQLDPTEVFTYTFNIYKK